MPKSHRFSVEYAKSSMATCRVCMAKIPKEALRVGHYQVEAENDASAKAEELDERALALAGAARWHHFECFPKMKGQKWMLANLPATPASLQGFKDLKKGDKKRMEKLWQVVRGADTKASKGLKRPAAAMEGLSSVQGVLTAAQFKKICAEEGKLSPFTGAKLTAELTKNKQPHSGKKDELIQRVAEGRVLGALPSCPRCKHGQVHWSRVGGWFSCPGYYDKEAKLQKRCHFRSKEMKRLAWRK
mmetsp:Transcript_83058/g.199341  ORF Transcript_83058/g.199341 Transcript_83058/m.199341 type:complete len:244 (+) Transcript_83058:64-795(+)